MQLKGDAVQGVHHLYQRTQRSDVLVVHIKFVYLTALKE